MAEISGAEKYGGNIIFGGDELDYLQAHVEKIKLKLHKIRKKLLCQSF